MICVILNKVCQPNDNFYVMLTCAYTYQYICLLSYRGKVQFIHLDLRFIIIILSQQELFVVFNYLLFIIYFEKKMMYLEKVHFIFFIVLVFSLKCKYS